MCIALTISLASPLDMLDLPDPDAEGGLKVLGQRLPGHSGDANALQDRRYILGDGPALVVAHRPAGPVYQIQVVGEVEGQPLGPGLACAAHEAVYSSGG